MKNSNQADNKQDILWSKNLLSGIHTVDHRESFSYKIFCNI